MQDHAKRFLQTLEKTKTGEIDNQTNTNLTSSTKDRVMGEFAFGINPKERFVNEFLETEKILGTINPVFGANIDMAGGKNLSKNHMDMLISNPR